MPTPAGIPTIAETVADDYDLIVTCVKCHHDAQVDLAELIRRGFGDRSVYDLRWRCRCGARRPHFTVSPHRKERERREREQGQIRPVGP